MRKEKKKKQVSDVATGNSLYNCEYSFSSLFICLFDEFAVAQYTQRARQMTDCPIIMIYYAS